MARVSSLAAAGIALVCLGACASSPTAKSRGVGGRGLVLEGAAATSAASAASAPRTRRALVIGNGGYKTSPALRNPPHDAEAVEAAFRALAFDSVVRKTDLDRDALPAAVNEFVGSLRQDDAAVVFYAGHGVEIGGANYLLPVDFRALNEADAKGEGYALDRLLDRLESRKGGPNVVLLDACRNNPFAKEWSGGGARGFRALPGARAGTSVWFSTGFGSVADDGDGPDSPFTAALVGALGERPKEGLKSLFTEVKSRVRRTTNQRQEPFFYDAIQEDFRFAPVAAVATPTAVASVAQAQTTRTSRAIVVGVSHYADPGLSMLRFETGRDVLAMSRALHSLGYESEKRLVDEAATLQAIQATLDDARSQSRAGDRVAFYFAGAGGPIGASTNEPDGRDEALYPYDMRTGRQTDRRTNVDRATAFTDDDLASRFASLREKLGPSGHLLVVIDAYRIFEQVDAELNAAISASAAPLTLLQPARDYAGEAVKTAKPDDGTGFITRGFFVAASNADSSDSFHRFVKVMRKSMDGASPFAVALEGDEDVTVSTGQPTPGGTFVEVDPTLKYGALSAYLKGGRLHGIFPGTVVDFFAPTRFPPTTKPLARGTVVEAGTTWSRVELAARADVSRAWAMPVVRAMPPVAVHVSLDPSVTTKRAELEKRLAAISGARSVKEAKVAVVVKEQTNYGFVVDGTDVVAGPLELGSARYADQLTGAIWQLAFARYLATVELPKTLGIRASVTTASLGSPEVDCRDQLRVRVTAEQIRDGASASGQTRGLARIWESAHGAALVIDARGEVSELLGADMFDGSANACGPAAKARATVRAFASAFPLELHGLRAAPGRRRDPDVGAIPARPNEAPLGTLDPVVSSRLARLDGSIAASATARPEPAPSPSKAEKPR